MAVTHYKLPYDDVVDKDISDWINKFSRTKKGEMVRHAIRYYMVMEGVSINFPNVQSNIQQVPVEPMSQSEKNKSERPKVKPVLDGNALK